MTAPHIKITGDTRQARSEINELEDSLKGLDKTSKLAAGAFAAVTAAFGVREIIDYTARWTDLNSRLVNATGSQQAASRALDAISASARRTYSDLETTADVFIRNSMALNELGYTTNEQLKVSEALNNAMAVSGARGEQAARALDAFAKAMATGKLQNDQLNSIVEASPRLFKALADGLGVSSGELRKLATEGKLTASEAIPALISQIDALRSEAEAMPATISDAFIVLQNNLFKMIGRMDEALGISSSLSEALVYLADNVHLVIGGVVGIGLAVAALTVKMMGLATATAFATAGLSVIAAGAVGAALAAAAKEAGLFAFMADKAVDPMEQQKRAAEDAAAAVKRQATAAKTVNDEQKKALATLDQNLLKLEQSLKFEQDKANLTTAEANANKMIREESEKLAQVGLTLSNQARERIILINQELEALAQRQSLENSITGYQTQIIEALVQDRNQREIILAIRAKELEFGRALTDAERERITVTLETLQALNQENQLKETIKGLEDERLLLAIRDKNERELQTIILREQEKIGRSLTDIERERLTNSVRLTQQSREQAAIEEAIAEAKRDQTELEKIQRGLNLQKTIGGGVNQGFVTSQREYDRDLAALQTLLDRKIISEQEYYQQREELTRQFNEKAQQLELERIEKTLMAERSGLATVLSERDRAALKAVGQQERQRAIVRERIEFEKKSELEKAQFAIQQSATIFNALGAQNKKAFEAAKAFNIANAIMNTYMAATKALATYPWPFGLVAAAAAVASGLAQVAQIRSQTYSGRQLGGPVMANQSYIVGENGPELFTPNNSGSITRNNQLGGSGAVNVNFNIQANDAQGFDQLLYQRRGLITQIISDAMQEKGRRSIV